MSIKLETKFLQSPQDSGGSGGGNPDIAKASPKTLGPGDAYSGKPLPSAPNSGLDVRKHVTSSRKPKVKTLSTKEINAELSKMADGLRMSDPMRFRRDEANWIFRHALDYLKEYFRPEQVTEGEPPQYSLIIRSLRNGYRETHTGKTVDKRNSQIEHLIEPFYAFVQREDVAATLGLRGTKSKKIPQKKAATKKAIAQKDIVARVMYAQVLFESIESMGGDFDEAAALLAEAEGLASSLNSLGRSPAAIAEKTSSQGAAAAALKKAARLSEIADLFHYHRTRAATSFEEDRIEYYIGFVRADMDAWIGDHAAALRGPLELVLHDYIGFWLAEQAGDTPPGIKLSQAALENAITGAAIDIEDSDRKAEFDSLARQMMHYLVRRESIRSRLTSAAQSRGEAVAAPPISRHMATYEEFGEAIGPDLLASLNEFYRAIQRGEVGGRGTESERNARASAFNELFIHYVRYAANVYGDHFGPDLMREKGLEPQLVRAIYSRVENARAYGEEPVELLRTFFSEHVTNKEIPSIDELMPMGGVSYSAEASIAAGGALKFVDYGPGEVDDFGMTVDEFLQEMPFPTGPEFRTRFEAAVGYSFDAFRRWGSIRRRPKNKTQKEWEAEIEDARRRGHLEDVTQEPRTQAALDAILPAIIFLKEEAAKYGMAIDTVDIAAAISSVIRRMRAAASGGVIRINVPSFMKDLPFRNWGYPTFAQQIINHKLATEVVRETLRKHAHGDVEQPEYWDIRRYTVPLAEGSGGGIDQQWALYEFAAGLMRWAHVLDNAAYVYDSAGGLVTFAPSGMPSKYHIQLEPDHATYLSGTTGLKPGTQRKLFLDIRRGHYDQLLDMLRSYLYQIRELHADVDLTWSDGRDVKLDTLREMYFTLAAVHDWYKAMIMDRSATSSTRSEEDLVKIGEFYSDLRTFFEEVVFHMRARGTIDSALGQVEFDASVRLSEHEYNAEKFGRTTLFLDDAFETSERHGWDIPRRDNLIDLKVYLGRAIAEGDISQDEAVDAVKIMEATRRFWAGSEESFVQAANDLATLEKEHRKSKTEESVSGVRRRATAGKSWRTREPVLPNRSTTETWSNQWREFASEQGLSEENIESAVDAMTAYFQAVPGFYNRFMEGILGDAVDERVDSQADRDEIKAAIAEFFPTLGIANGEVHEVRRIDDDSSVESQLAQWAVEDYVIGFPEHGVNETQVPVFDDVLATFVNIQCMNHRERLPQPSIVMAKARQILEDYNRTREPSAATLSVKGLKLEAEGLLGKRLGDYLEGLELEEEEAAAVRRAYVGLNNYVREREDIERSKIEDAIAKQYGSAPAMLVDTLAGFIEMQKSDLAAWRALVTDPRLGLPAYVREHFSASYVMNEGLVALANEYAGDRLTSYEPTSPLEISEAIVGDAFSPYTEISERMAQSYRTLFAMWLENVGAQLEAELSHMRISLKDIASDDVEPVSSVGELISNAEEQTAEDLKLKSFDSSSVERNLATIYYLTDAERAETIEDIAAALFEFEVEPAIRKTREEAAELKREAKNEIDEIYRVVGAATKRSTDIFLDWQTPVDVSRMSEKILLDFIQQSDAEKADLIELSEQLSTLKNSPDRMESLNADFGPIDGFSQSIVESLREDIERSEEQIESALANIEKSTIMALKLYEELDATREERKLARDAAEVRTVVATTSSALTGAMEELEGLEAELAELEGEAVEIRKGLLGTEGDVQGRFEDATSAQTKLAEAAGKLSAKIDITEGRVAKLIRAKGDYADTPTSAQSLPKAMEALSSSNAFATEDDFAEQLTLLENLEELERNARGALKTVAPMQERLEAILSDVSSAFDEAEEEMPKGKAAGIPEPKVTEGYDRGISMTSKAPSTKVHLKAQKSLKPLMDGSVLTVGNESYLLSVSEATRVSYWFIRNRSNTSITSDVFGNRIKLMVGLRGVRLDTLSSLPEGHPFRAILNALEHVLRESSPEAAVLAQLSKSSYYGLLRELLAHLSTVEVITSVDEARSAMRSWFVANAERLMDALGPSVKKFFTVPHSTEGIDYAEDNVSENYEEYGPEEHEARGKRYTTILARPEIGKLIMNYSDVETGKAVKKSQYYVRLAEARKALDERLNVIEVFNVSGDRYDEIDLNQIKSKYAIKASIEQFPIGDQPERIANLRLLERIHGDPRLMALGWLLAKRKSLDPGLQTYISKTLFPIKMTPLGKEPPISLLRAQEAAVIAYVDLTSTPNAMPEIGRVTDQAISEFVDTYTDEVLNMHDDITAAERDQILARKEWAKAEFHNNAQLRRMLAQSLLTSSIITKSGVEELHYHSVRGFSTICKMGKLSANEKRNLAMQYDDIYGDMRPEILKDTALLQKSTGMHAPHEMIGFVEQDGTLEKSHPETYYVGAVQMKNVHAVLMEDRIGAPAKHRELAKRIAGLMEFFPEFAGALSLIGMVFEGLPDTLKDELSAILSEYVSVEGLHSAESIEEFRGRIRRAYSDHADMIREKLARKDIGGISFAEYLTGMENPWADKADWSSYPADQALFAIAPEFSKVSAKKVEKAKRDIAAKVDARDADSTKSLRAILGFMEMYPLISPAVVMMMPVMIKHLPKDLSNEICDKFFDYDNGAWSNLDAARRMASEHGSTRVTPDKLFASLIASNIREVRRALSKPLPELEGQSAFEWFTGMKQPWKLEKAKPGSVEEAYRLLLPPMDLVQIQGMNLSELIKHIESRLAKLKLLPGNQKLKQQIFLWREKQKELIEAGKAGIPDSDNLPEAFVKMMLAIEKADIVLGRKDSHPLTNEITQFLAEKEFVSYSVMLKDVYSFIIEQRAEITQATRELIGPKVAVNGKILSGSGSGGKGSGGEGAPPAASSGGGVAPPVASSGGSPSSIPPASSAHSSAHPDFGGIVRSSAVSVYVSETTESVITDAEDLHAEGGMEYMAGSTMNATVFGATAMHASMGMAL